MSSSKQLLIRGGPLFWAHWLTTYGLLVNLFVAIGVGVAANSTAVGYVIAATWLIGTIVLGARVSVRVEEKFITIDNGFYRRTFPCSAVDRVTLQNLPMAGAGKGFPFALAIWAGGAEGWPAMATTSWSDERRETLAREISDASGLRRGRSLHVVNRGWRPASFSRRTPR